MLMVQILEQIDLEHRGFFLLLLQSREHNLLRDVLLVLLFVSDKVGSPCNKNKIKIKDVKNFAECKLTEVASANALDFLVVFLVLLIHF